MRFRSWRLDHGNGLRCLHFLDNWRLRRSFDLFHDGRRRSGDRPRFIGMHYGSDGLDKARGTELRGGRLRRLGLLDQRRLLAAGGLGGRVMVLGEHVAAR